MTSYDMIVHARRLAVLENRRQTYFYEWRVPEDRTEVSVLRSECRNINIKNLSFKRRPQPFL